MNQQAQRVRDKIVDAINQHAYIDTQEMKRYYDRKILIEIVPGEVSVYLQNYAPPVFKYNADTDELVCFRVGKWIAHVSELAETRKVNSNFEPVPPEYDEPFEKCEPEDKPYPRIDEASIQELCNEIIMRYNL